MAQVFGPEPAKKKHTCGYAGPDKAPGAGSCGKWVQVGEPSTSWVGDDSTRIRYCGACAHKGGWASAPTTGPVGPGSPAGPGPSSGPPQQQAPTTGPVAGLPSQAGKPYGGHLICPKCSHPIPITVG